MCVLAFPAVKSTQTMLRSAVAWGNEHINLRCLPLIKKISFDAIGHNETFSHFQFGDQFSPFQFLINKTVFNSIYFNGFLRKKKFN